MPKNEKSVLGRRRSQIKKLHTITIEVVQDTQNIYRVTKRGAHFISKTKKRLFGGEGLRSKYCIKANLKPET